MTRDDFAVTRGVACNRFATGTGPVPLKVIASTRANTPWKWLLSPTVIPWDRSTSPSWFDPTRRYTAVPEAQPVVTLTAFC